MGNRLTSVLISLAVILVIFAVIMFVFGTQTLGPFNFSVDQATLAAAVCVCDHWPADRLCGVPRHAG